MRSLIIAIMFSTLAAATASAQGKVTCSQGRSACLRTGGDNPTCQQRYESCVQSGCWMGGLVQKCGYAKK